MDKPFIVRSFATRRLEQYLPSGRRSVAERYLTPVRWPGHGDGLGWLVHQNGWRDFSASLGAPLRAIASARFLAISCDEMLDIGTVVPQQRASDALEVGIPTAG